MTRFTIGWRIVWGGGKICLMIEAFLLFLITTAIKPNFNAAISKNTLNLNKFPLFHYIISFFFPIQLISNAQYNIAANIRSTLWYCKESKIVGGDNNAKERKGHEGVNCHCERLSSTSMESKQKGGLVKGVWEGCACFIFT